MSNDRKPTIITSFPGQAVEDFRQRRGTLPGADKNADEAEQARVQLAGCLTIAEGIYPDPAVTNDDYGWSRAYEKTHLLRRAFDRLAGGMSPEEVLTKVVPA